MGKRQNHPPTCTCGKAAKIRGFCQNCYQKARYRGEIEIYRPDAIHKYLVKLMKNIILRCTDSRVNKFQYYGGKGIKNELTIEDLRFLYERDNAHLLERPSIDRKDSTKNYSLENCRFIELRVNTVNRTVTLKARCKRCGKLDAGCGYRGYECSDCHQYRWCKDCKKPFERGEDKLTLCDNCRYVVRPCAYCGAAVKRCRVIYKATLRNKQWFCSRIHQGKWLGSNFGRGAQVARQNREAA